MMDQGVASAQSGSTDVLLRAARVLLNRGVDLDALQVLHAEIARSLAVASTPRVPERYSSLAEAQRLHERLLSTWKQHAAVRPPVSPMREFLRSRPPWFSRAAIVVVAIGLSLRYVWHVTYGKNWAQQNPEGNWISRFYGNATFEGFPLVRYDVGVNADFGVGAPADSMKKDFFSARWDTCVVVTRDVVVPLQLDSDDGSKLFLDEQLQFEVEPGPGQQSAPVALHVGLRHLRVDFVEKAGTAMVRLSGLELDGTDAYAFRRPTIEGEDVRCR